MTFIQKCLIKIFYVISLVSGKNPPGKNPRKGSGVGLVLGYG